MKYKFEIAHFYSLMFLFTSVPTRYLLRLQLLYLPSTLPEYTLYRPPSLTLPRPSYSRRELCHDTASPLLTAIIPLSVHSYHTLSLPTMLTYQCINDIYIYTTSSSSILRTLYPLWCDRYECCECLQIKTRLCIKRK